MSREIVTIFCRFSNWRLQGNCALIIFMIMRVFVLETLVNFSSYFPLLLVIEELN